jgi:hypothetical protein
MSDASNIESAGHGSELPLTVMQKALEECVVGLNGRIKHCVRSAFHHLRRSWLLYGKDNEMCAFRAITAEEEAATALIFALKQRNYDGALLLNHRNHVHKSAFTPFLRAVEPVLSQMEFAAPKIRIAAHAKPPRIDVILDANAAGFKFDEPQEITIDEPLNFVVSKLGPDGGNAVHLFEEQFKAVADGKGADSIKAFIAGEANLRNELLYAADSGVPAVSFATSFITERARRVGAMVGLTIAVLQTPKHQLFVQQGLYALLKALERIEKPSEQFAPPTSVDNGLVVTKLPDAEPTAIFRRTYQFQGVIGYDMRPVQQVTLAIDKQIPAAEGSEEASADEARARDA